MQSYGNYAKQGEVVLAGEGVLWVQPLDRSCSPPIPLGCVGLGDIENDFGEFFESICRDLSEPNKWRVVKKSRGRPEPIETTLTTPITKEANILDRLNCPFAVYWTVITDGRNQTIWDYWQSGFAIHPVEKRSFSMSGLDGSKEQGEPTIAYAVQADEFFWLRRKEAFAITIGSVSAVQGMTVSGSELCATESELGAEANQYQMITLADGTARYSSDAASSWASVGQPHGDAGISKPVLNMVVGSNTRRFMAFRSDATGANPLELAYTDDGGTSWNAVTVGAGANSFTTTPHSAFTFGRSEVWAVDNKGFIYTSTDFGQSWTERDESALAASWNVITMASSNEGYVFGAAGAGARFNGNSWTALTAVSADAGLSAMVLGDVVFAGTDGGEVYRSFDKGVTWETVSFPGAGNGTVPQMVRVNDLQAAFIHVSDAGVGSVLTTVTGGCLWRKEPLPAGVGELNALAAGDRFDRLYAGGAGGATYGVFDADLVG